MFISLANKKLVIATLISTQYAMYGSHAAGSGIQHELNPAMRERNAAEERAFSHPDSMKEYGRHVQSKELQQGRANAIYEASKEAALNPAEQEALYRVEKRAERELGKAAVSGSYVTPDRRIILSPKDRASVAAALEQSIADTEEGSPERVSRLLKVREISALIREAEEVRSKEAPESRSTVDEPRNTSEQRMENPNNDFHRRSIIDYSEQEVALAKGPDLAKNVQAAPPVPSAVLPVPQLSKKELKRMREAAWYNQQQIKFDRFVSQGGARRMNPAWHGGPIRSRM